MVATLLGIGLLIVLAYVFFSLMGRSLRSRRLLVRIPGSIITGLLGVVFSAAVILAVAGIWRSEAPRVRPAADVKVTSTPEQVARGEQLAWLCADCHSLEGELPLNGGISNMLATGLPLGEVYAPNLTPGSRVAKWTDGELIRAIREGLDAEGMPLLAMPDYHGLSDDDAEALVAYLRGQVALRHDQPPRNPGLLLLGLLGAGFASTAEQPALSGRVQAPPRGNDAGYGRYLVGITGCADCHGAAFDGVPNNRIVVRGPSLRAVLPNWTEDQFVALFRTGMLPGDRPVPQGMPAKSVGHALTDEDLRGMFTYLRSLGWR